MYWLLLNMYSENSGFGLGGFKMVGGFCIRGKGLVGKQKVFTSRDSDSSVCLTMPKPKHRHWTG